jgi:hypothetical protein
VGAKGTGPLDTLPPPPPQAARLSSADIAAPAMIILNWQRANALSSVIDVTFQLVTAEILSRFRFPDKETAPMDCR